MNPQLADRVLVELGTESVRGMDAGAFSQVALYGNVDEMIEPDAAVATRMYHGKTYSGDVIPGGIMWRLPRLATVLYGSGDPALPPVWTNMLPACGWTPRWDLSDSTRTVWRLQDSDASSLTIRLNRDGTLYKALGAVGELSIGCDQPGNMIAVSATLAGHREALSQESMAADEYESVTPIAFCNAGFTISPEGEADIVPAIKSFQIAGGLAPVVRRNWNRNLSARVELVRQSFATWTVVVERNADYDYTQWYEEKRRFLLTQTLGEDVGNKYRMTTPEGAVVRLLQAPGDGRDGASLRTESLVFGILSSGGLEIAAL